MTTTQLILLGLVCCGLWCSVTATCGAQLTSTVPVDVASPNIIKKLWVQSIYPFSVTQGTTFEVSFTGTDKGEATWVASDKEVTMQIASDGYTFVTPTAPNAPNAPNAKNVFASSTRNTASIATVIILGAALLRLAPKNVAVVLVAVLALASMSFIETSGDIPCTASVTISIPSGKVQQICDVSDNECICGPDWSGPNCDYYKSTCQPTAEQMQKRLDTQSAFAPESMALPAPGESWCDSNYGTEVWRLTNREPFPDNFLAWTGPPDHTNDQRVHLSGYIGFSPGYKYFYANTFAAPIMYDVNMDEYGVPHINATKRTVIRPIQAGSTSLLFDLGVSKWASPHHVMFQYGSEVYLVDVEQTGVAERGYWEAVKVGDFTRHIATPYYSEPYQIDRCSFARTRPNGAIRMSCNMLYGIHKLEAPDVNHIDSHPNATCINYAWGEGLVAYIGYVVVDIVNPLSSADPEGNTELVTRFVNGLDSDKWYCTQTFWSWSSTLQDYRRYMVYNFINNGYKVRLDMSGEWIADASVVENTDLSSPTGFPFAPTVKIKFRPFSEGGGVIRSHVHTYHGHGGYGWATAIAQCGAPGKCNATCISYFDFYNITDDDVGTVFPNSIILPNMDDLEWIFNHGLYGSMMHATATNRREGVLQSGCDASRYNCDTMRFGSEIMKVIPDDNGGGSVERLLSTRDGSWTQYSLVTSECEDTGPCWGAFQSSWGVPRVNTETPVLSDVFIFRFR